MLQNGITIRHRGDIISDNPCALTHIARGDGVTCFPLPFQRQGVGLGHKQIEQVCHHPFCLAGHSIDLEMPPHVGEQEIAQCFKIGRHFRAESNHRRRSTANVIGMPGTQPLQIGCRLVQQILNKYRDQAAYKLCLLYTSPSPRDS